MGWAFQHGPKGKKIFNILGEVKKPTRHRWTYGSIHTSIIANQYVTREGYMHAPWQQQQNCVNDMTAVWEHSV